MFAAKAETDNVQDTANAPFAVVNVLKDELFYTDDRLREEIIQPSRPMAGLRKTRSDKQKKKSVAATSKTV